MPSHATDEEPSRLSVSIGNVSPTRSPTRSQAALSTHNRSVSQPQDFQPEPLPRTPFAELHESSPWNNESDSVAQQDYELEMSGLLSGLAGPAQDSGSEHTRAPLSPVRDLQIDLCEDFLVAC